ncbi:unnamed protein product [Agarophyton chilense]
MSHQPLPEVVQMTVTNSLRISIVVLVLILSVYLLSVNELGALLPHSTPRHLKFHEQQYSDVVNTPHRNISAKQPSDDPVFGICVDSFHFPESLNFASPCFVSPPKGYTKPYSKPECFWKTPRANIGNNNNDSKLVELHMDHQNWAFFKDDDVIIRINGGTSVRNFGTNFDYVREVLKWIDLSPIASSNPNSSKAMLDTGAGIGSVSAAFEDERSEHTSTLKVFSYVLPDDYLRLGSIIADRRLNSMLQSFSGNPLPFPANSFHIVHCRWCWHHLQGYDKWLDEVNRLVIPGGYFIFTFTPLRDKKLLPPEQWKEALKKQPWNCDLHAKIMRVCRKDNPRHEIPAVTNIDWSPDFAQEFSTTVRSSFDKISSLTGTGIDSLRILNINCQPGNQCLQMETLLNSRSVTNTFQSKFESALTRALTSGSVGFIHNWNKPGPFYPRSFDVVHLLCEQSARPPSWILALKSLELHRLLAPGGMVLLMSSSCPQYENIQVDWSGYGFRVSHKSDKYVLFHRIEY